MLRRLPCTYRGSTTKRPFQLPSRSFLGLGNLFDSKPLDHSHKERRLLEYPARHVYNVVSNVADYPKFVPWCVDAHILMDNGHYMEAELAVGFNMFHERYISKVTKEQDRRVEAISKDTQLFHYLNNEWLFSAGPTPASCWLSFKIDFAFRSALYAQASGLFMDEVVNKMVSAFDERCRTTFAQYKEQAAAAQVAAATQAADKAHRLRRYAAESSQKAAVDAPAKLVSVKLDAVGPRHAGANQQLSQAATLGKETITAPVDAVSLGLVGRLPLGDAEPVLRRSATLHSAGSANTSNAPMGKGQAVMQRATPSRSAESSTASNLLEEVTVPHEPHTPHTSQSARAKPAQQQPRSKLGQTSPPMPSYATIW